VVSRAPWVLDCALVKNISCIQSSSRLKEQDKDFLFRDRLMFHALWNNQKFSLVERDIAFPQAHEKFSLDHQKHFIFFVMMMPDKLPQKFGKLHMLTVQFPNNARTPMFIERRELFSKVDFIHARLDYSPNSSFRKAGNSNTSRMLCLFVSNITRRSMPMPNPPLGGIP